MSIKPARIRTIVVAVLVLAFVIPWTYAHIDDNNHSDFLGGARDLHRGDSITVEGVGTFTLKEAHSDIVWFTPNPGKATFCFTPDPTFTVNPYV